MHQLMGALRVSARALYNVSRVPPSTKFHSFAAIIHRSSLRGPIAHSTPLYFTVQCQRRTLSLGSIFPRPAQTPHAAVVANIARLEAEANTVPQVADKQLALFRALVDTKNKLAYGVVINRWERMCEFDASSPLLRSDEAFQLYLTSLVNSGHEKSIDPAVRRRESLLASTVVATPSESPQPDSSSSATTKAGPSVTTSPLSRSQEIAQAVISGAVSTSPFTIPAQAGPTSSVDLTQLVAALSRGGNQSNPIHVTANEPKGAFRYRIVRLIIWNVMFMFFTVVIISILLENTGLLKTGPRHTEFEPLQQKTVKFSDVHGVEEAKEELKDIVEFLKDPTIFSTLGGKLPKGVLLTGPPGTGKTLLARAVAGEAGVPFLFASGSEFEEMYVGVGAKRVRELFAAARKKQPAIIFIDELDAVGGKRSSKDQQYTKQTLNQLLVEMDGFLQTEGVIVIAATNFAESLDPALMRPGRFDRVIAVPLPDIRGRVQILQHHMRDVTTSPEADPTILARGTVGFSGADLENLVNQAAIQASKERCREVMLSHFEWAKDRIIMGSERKSAYMNDKNKLMTAYHEAGHALASLYTEGATPLHKVTCVPRGHSLGMTTSLPEDDRVSVSLKEYYAQIDVCMGGRAAEEIIYGPDNVTSGASSDLQQATRTARAMVKYFGFSDKIGPVYYSDREDNIAPLTMQNIDTEVRDILRAGEARVIAMLKSREQELHLLAHALVEHETLNADEVRKVVKGEPIRNIKEIINEDLSVLAAESTVSSPVL